MKPKIGKTGFGYAEVGGARISHDFLIRLGGEVKKRKKKLSKAVYGTSHKISLEEAKHIYQDGAKHLIIGGGHFGRVELTPDAEGYFNKKKCVVEIHTTPRAARSWNEAEGKTIALFHTTC
jgi:hypothetical protein